jgi:hypothetical protein
MHQLLEMLGTPEVIAGEVKAHGMIEAPKK